MAKALNIVINQEFISDQDKDEEIKTTWILRSLTGLEFLRCCSSGYVDHDMIIELGLVGWKKFLDGEGKDIEFHVNMIPKIPPLYLQDISAEIQRISIITEDERKNSSSQSK